MSKKKKTKAEIPREYSWLRMVARLLVAVILIGVIWFLLTRFLCPMMVN
jgi:flagellar biogenesis protein FliO